MKLVEVPGKGLVEFPDEMSPQDITSAIQQMIGEPTPGVSAGEGPLKPGWEQDLQAHIQKTVMPQEPFSFRRLGANALRMGGPMVVGAATGGMGMIPAAGLTGLAGAASEAGAEKIEGQDLSPFRIGLAGLFGAAGRPARAIKESFVGGSGRMNEAMRSGGAEIVNPTTLTQATQDVTRRLGPNPTAPSSRRVLEDVTERVTRPGALTLRDVEDIRRNTGSAMRTYKSPATKEASGQFYGAAKKTMEGAEAGGSKAAGQLLEGISAEAARNALTQKMSLREILTLLGAGVGGGLGTYGATGSPAGLAAGVVGLEPLLSRLYQASAALRTKPVYDAALGGLGNVAATEALRRWRRQ